MARWRDILNPDAPQQGFRVSAPLYVGQVGFVQRSFITWEARGNVVVEVGLSSASDVLPDQWLVATKNAEIPGIEQGTNLTGLFLWTKQTLIKGEDDSRPKIEKITVAFEAVHEVVKNAKYGIAFTYDGGETWQHELTFDKLFWGADAVFAGKVVDAEGRPLVGGGEGVLSTFVFVSAGSSYGGDWAPVGWIDIGGMTQNKPVDVTFQVPSNFTVTKASLILACVPVFVDDSIYPQYNKWTHARSLRVYMSEDTDGFFYWYLYSEPTGIQWRDQVDITSQVWGSSWSPSLAYTGQNSENTQNKIQYKTGDIKQYITPGKLMSIRVASSAPPNASLDEEFSMAKAIVIVEGYTTLN